MKRMPDGFKPIKHSAVLACAVMLGSLLAACGSGPAASSTVAPTTAATSSTAVAAPTAAASSSTTAPVAGNGKVALLLPETKTTRYETADRPDFQQKFMALCPSCRSFTAMPTRMQIPSSRKPKRR